MVVDGHVVYAGDRGQVRHRSDDFGSHVVAVQVAHPVQRAGLDGATVADDGHALRQPLDLAQDMAGEQHRGPGGGVLGDVLVEHLLHERVEARGWFVEDQ